MKYQNFLIYQSHADVSLSNIIYPRTIQCSRTTFRFMHFSGTSINLIGCKKKKKMETWKNSFLLRFPLSNVTYPSLTFQTVFSYLEKYIIPIPQTRWPLCFLITLPLFPPPVFSPYWPKDIFLILSMSGMSVLSELWQGKEVSKPNHRRCDLECALL